MRLSIDELGVLVRRLEGRGYKAYGELRGLMVRYGIFRAVFTRVQGDPFATPSILEARTPLARLRVSARLYRGSAAVPFTDYVARRAWREARRHSGRCGTGSSCYLGFPEPGPWILPRSAAEIVGDELVVRLYVGLPARGRRILGREAERLLTRGVGMVLEAISRLENEVGRIERHVENYLDQEYLRKWLYEEGYAFFVAEGSILPRESSLSERPMKGAVPFRPPEGLAVSVELPSGRRIRGMAVPMGVFLVTGGGYHGKTTLLEAVQQGIYNHVEGDGRELVVSRRSTILLKAEDGRLVSHVDISGFISRLPGGADTKDFSTLDASGSTSMAASIAEAIEAGAEVLLIDEDTSATNLLFKDEYMASLIPNEPIRPLSTLARSLTRSLGLGLVVVSGSSAAFVPCSDRVILVDSYVPAEVTGKAKNLVGRGCRDALFRRPRGRVYHGIRGLRRVRARGFKLVANYVDGRKFELDLEHYPRVVEKGQVKLLALMVERLASPSKPLRVSDIPGMVEEKLAVEGFRAFARPVPPDLTYVAGFDLVWALNRMYNAVFSQD